MNAGLELNGMRSIVANFEVELFDNLIKLISSAKITLITYKKAQTYSWANFPSEICLKLWISSLHKRDLGPRYARDLFHESLEEDLPFQSGKITNKNLNE